MIDPEKLEEEKIDKITSTEVRHTLDNFFTQVVTENVANIAGAGRVVNLEKRHKWPKSLALFNLFIFTFLYHGKSLASKFTIVASGSFTGDWLSVDGLVLWMTDKVGGRTETGQTVSYLFTTFAILELGLLVN